MNSIKQTINKNPDGWFEHYLAILLEHPVNDVLDYLYNPETIENYLEDKNKALTSEILEWLKNSRQYRYRDTGEPFVVDEMFFDGFFDLQLNRKQFKSKINQGKFSTSQLLKFHKILHDADIFYNPKTE